MPVYDFAIIGAGIVGLATARSILRRLPDSKILVLEKEAEVARHQTGRNSGVIHAGVYYKPGSLKARLCVEGNRAMVEFCGRHGIPHDVCGKLIVASDDSELPQLDRLVERARQNGLDVKRISAEEAREYEPNVHCVAAIHSPSTGITNYALVSRKYAELITAAGGRISFGAGLARVVEKGSTTILETEAGAFETHFTINCAGLHSDRVATLFGVNPKCRIVPFRGEYYELTPETRSLVRNLIYPVPDPAFPFLGVHFTRMVDGSVHCGPNAVLALKREGYLKTDVNARDLFETLLYPGFWRLARKHAAMGFKEMVRSVNKGAFVRSLQTLVPAVRRNDLVPAHAGVRAQALKPDGGLVDDFLIVKGARSIHVCNAPSPAATASIPIGEAIADQATGRAGLRALGLEKV